MFSAVYEIKISSSFIFSYTAIVHVSSRVFVDIFSVALHTSI